MNYLIRVFPKLFLIPANTRFRHLADHSAPIFKFTLALILICLLQPLAKSLTAQGLDSPAIQTGSSHPLPSETPHFNHLTTQDGLAHNHVSSIIQDRNGFMWFGNESGLNRYDGYRFSRYHHIPDNPTSLSSNNVSEVLEGPNGYIWVGTEDGGLNRVDPASDPESGQVVRYTNDPEDPTSLSHNHIESLAFDQDGILWIGTGLGLLNRFDPATETFSHYDPPTIEANPVAIEALFVRPDGTLWVGGEALFHFDPAAETFTPYAVNANVGGGPPNDGANGGPPPGDPPPGGPPPGGGPGPGNQPGNGPPPGAGPPSSNHVNGVYEDPDGRVWIASSTLFLLQPPGVQMTRFPLPEGQRAPLQKIMDDGNGRLWLAAQNGLHIFDIETGEYVRYYRNEPGDPNSLSGEFITSFYQSPEELIWIGTTSGINIFAWQQSPFTTYSPGMPPLGFANPNVHDILLGSNDRLWIAGGPYISRLDRQSGEAQSDRPDIEVSANISQFILGIDHIYLDPEEYIWLDDVRGVARLDTETLEMTPFPLPESETEMIIDWRAAPGGTFWIVSAHYLYQFDPETGTYTSQYEYLPADEAASPGLAVETLRIDSYGFVWTSGAGFLIAFNPGTEQFQYYFHDSEDPTSISRGKVTDVYRDPDGLVWLASESGLLTLDESTGQFERYTEADGLPSDGVMAILPEENGRLWLSTFLGLSRFDPDDKTFRNFNQEEGLSFDEFIAGSAYKSADGELFFGGRGGIVSFYPDAVTQNSYLPPVVITEMRLGNTPVFPGQDNGVLSAPIWNTNELTLNHDQDIIAFDFAALSYTSPEQNRYRYTLEGLEEGWVEGGLDIRSARYTTLPPGSYTFRVEGTNNDGLWSDQEASLHITVKPAWWETIWFRGLVLLAVVGVVVGGTRWRVVSIRRRNQELEKQVAVRTQELAESNQQLLTAKEAAEVASNAKSTFLSSMSHELRTPLNGVLGYAQILRRDRNLTPQQADGLQVIYDSGQHLLTLINDVLDLAKVEAGKLELVPAAFRLGPFLDGIVALMRMSAQQKNIRFIYEPDPDLPSEVEADEKRLRQILINLLGNAIKFTDAGAVTFRVIHQPDRSSGPGQAPLRFEIEDSGVGMTAEQLEKIFQPFEQVGQKEKQSAGTGLGLPISQQLVELMGGQIRVNSQPDQGSLFWFEISLPIGVVRQETERLAASTINGYEGPRRTILVADDRQENRMVLFSLLEPLGFEVILAVNGRQALELTQARKPDLLLIDLVMPELTGFETVQAIRQLPNLKELPIIAISASVFAMDQAKSRLAGCDAFLPKPIEADRLMAHIENLLDLTWRFDAPAPAEEVRETAVPPTPLILPPAETLEMLYELAMLGKITQIREQIALLEQDNSQYTPFVQKIRTMADAFEDKEIAAFVRGAMDIDGPIEAAQGSDND